MFTRLACLGLSRIPVKERERVSDQVSNQRFVNSCVANSPSVYIHSYRHLITSSAPNECLLVHTFQNKCCTECHKIYVSGPFGIFCLYVILTISYLRAQTIETSSLPTDSSRPCSSKSRFFLAYRLYISTVSTFLNIRASY